MKKSTVSKKIFIEELMEAAKKVQVASKGLSIGVLIKFIREQLGMSQKILAKRAGVPQSTISRIEVGKSDLTISTLDKVLHALECDLILCPLLQNTVDNTRQKRARKVAKQQVSYLKETMNLEDQLLDYRFVEKLLQQEEERLLHEPNANLWNDQ